MTITITIIITIRITVIIHSFAYHQEVATLIQTAIVTIKTIIATRKIIIVRKATVIVTIGKAEGEARTVNPKTRVIIRRVS